ncbi:MAG TPA: AI-2E family transporter, partial [Dehalococcoidia bacterium]|nr:AI-2E family transporter [Dehalococcoidia bacterium]
MPGARSAAVSAPVTRLLARPIRGIRWLAALGIVVLALLAGRLVPVPLEHIAVVLFAAVVIAAAIAPVATFFQRGRIPRGVTVVGVYLFVLALLAGIVILLIPLVTDEVTQLQQRLPEYQQSLQRFVARASPSLADRIFGSSMAGNILSRLSGFLNQVPGYFFAVTSVVVELFVVLVLAYLMAAQQDFSEQLVLRFVRARHRPRARRLLSAGGHSLGRWALGAILLALYFGVAFGVGLKVAGIPYAVTLGAVGAVLEIIPYVGGALTMLIAALAASTKGLLYIGIAVGWYAVVAEVEAHIVHPWLVGRVVR